VQARIDALAERQRAHLATIAGRDAVRNPRALGTIAAFELGAGQDYLSDLGPRLLAHFRERDLLVRPMGNSIYVMPPYSITPEQLARIWGGIDEAIARFGS
jgi:adenosylmethionine-8-amino-7-oxononanoate aminotransferase